MLNILKKNFVFIACVLASIIFLSLFLYSDRQEYLTPFDVAYWKDRFEHSQWVLPLSRRAIGDDALFSYLGYRMVLGDDPTSINAETLPVGKYLIGLSIVYLGNPAYYALIFGIFTLLVFYGLAHKLFSSTQTAIILTTLLLLEPLFFTQLTKAWIDLLQLFTLLAHWFLLISIGKKLSFESYILSLTCGISLGLFTEIKLPVLLPIIFCIDVFIIWKGQVSWRFIACILVGFILAIFASYTRFFLLGNSLSDFVTVQKYIVSFYLISQLSSHFTSVWQSLVTGIYASIYGGERETIQEWTILWPILFTHIFLVLYLVIKKREIYILSILFFVATSLIIFSLIPFYPRYLTLVVPFLYLLAGYTITRYQKRPYLYLCIAGLIIFSLLNNYKFISPRPEVLVNQFFYNMSYKFFQDIYVENLSRASTNLSQYQFFRLISLAFKDAGIETMEFKILDQKKISPSKTLLTVEVTYKTRSLGAFTEQKEITLVKENNKWKIVWNWNLVVNDFQPRYSFLTTIELGRRGSIRDVENNILAQDTQGYLFQIDLSNVDWSREAEMLAVLSKYSFQKSVHLQNTYLENPIPGVPNDVATNFVNLADKDLALLRSFPGVILTPFPIREYYGLDPKSIQNTFYTECCSRIYTSHK